MVDKCNKCGERHPEKECPNRKSKDKMKLTEKDKANIAAALAHSRKDKIKEILEAFGDNFSFFDGEIVGKEEHERFNLVFVRKIEVRHYTKNSPGFLHIETYADLSGEQIKKEIETRLFPDIKFYLKRDKLEEITGNEEKEALPEGESKMGIRQPTLELRWIETESQMNDNTPVAMLPNYETTYFKLQQHVNGEWLDILIEWAA